MSESAKPAAIMGSLVNLKNVSTHKSLALTIHVPAEAAQQVLAAFGWPTMVDPVPVAIARLEGEAPHEVPRDEPLRNTEEPPRSHPYVEEMRRGLAKGMQNVYAATYAEETPEKSPVQHRHWAVLSPAQQTGVIRNEPEFREFATSLGWDVHGADDARDFIRNFCGVLSCADILPGTEAAARWAQLQVRYGNWLSQKRALRPA
jgi:hypothetical protein